MTKPQRAFSLPDLSRDYSKIGLRDTAERERKSEALKERLCLNPLIVKREEKSEDFEERQSLSQCLNQLPISFKCVSHWKRRLVEDSLNLFYNDNFSGTPLDIINRLHFSQNLSKEQQEYIETIKKYMNISIGYGELSEIYLAAVLGDKLVVETKLEDSLKKLDSEEEEYIRRSVYKFLHSIINLLKALKVRRNLSDAYGRHYTMLFSSFAEMCCLNAELGMFYSDHSTWKNLGGLDQVISKPNIRLYKHGVFTRSSVDYNRVVSVVQVKKSRNKWKDNSSDSDEDSCWSTSSLASSKSSDSDSRKNVPKLELLLNSSVLGQHAGELLLDLYKHGRKESGDSVYKMPGMIVNGTMVFVTVLEISKDHYLKLTTNTDLEESDKAFIYYSRPFNILNENDRNILIESLVKLNNML